MKRLCLIILGFALALSLSAQRDDSHQHKFSPEKFDAELHAYIVKEARLSQQEAARFFPVYKEMQQKQRALMWKQRKLGMTKPTDEQGCLKAIQERDEIELEQKRILQCYHNKFLEVLSASKVYDVIKAEDRFHRHKLRQWSHGPKPQH
jgi:hypothetical protein